MLSRAYVTFRVAASDKAYLNGTHVSLDDFVNDRSDGYGCSDTAIGMGLNGWVFTLRICGLIHESIMSAMHLDVHVMV